MAVREPPLPPPPPNPDDDPGGPRPRKLTPALIRAAVELLLVGMVEAAVARRLLVGVRTWKKWKALGRKYPGGIYGTLLHQVVAAKEEYHARACRSIEAGMGDDPWLALAVLERRYPQHYGKYRGELGELKKRAREMEERVRELEKLIEGAAGEAAR